MSAERYWLWIEEKHAGPFTLQQIGRMAKADPPEEWDREDGNRDRPREFHESGIEWVEYLTAQNGYDCPFCVSMNGRRFRVGETPSMPLEGCTCSPWPISVWIAVGGPEGTL